MNKVLMLTKVQLRTAFSFHSSKPSKKNLIFYTSFLAITLLLAGTSFVYSYTLGIALLSIPGAQAKEILVLLPELMMVATSLITLLTTIYKVKGTLFGFKDYDMIMSLPVRTGEIAASRLLLLYLVNLLFTLIIMIPAGIAYGILVKASISFYILHMLTVFFIPLIPMIIATAIGTIIMLVSLKFKYSNSIHLILTVILISGIAILSFQAENSPQLIGEVSAAVTKQVEGLYPLAALYKRAVCGGEAVSLFLFVSMSVLAFLLFAIIIGWRFKKINTCLLATVTNGKYKLSILTQSTPIKALYRKELKRYLSSNLYVLNTAVGIVMLTIGAVVALFAGEGKIAQMLEIPEMADILGALAPVFVSGCVATCYITACSISLEGKNLWILKKAPISPMSIFSSKIAVSLTITVPAVILDGILIAIGFRLSIGETILVLLMPACYAVFIAVAGLIINLHLPNFNWTTEVSAIKQSGAALTATFFGLFAAIIPGAAVVLLGSFVSPLIINSLTTGIVVLCSLVMLYYLKTRGSRLFIEL
jgi:ABC-2 type transport system permease protein